MIDISFDLRNLGAEPFEREGGNLNRTATVIDLINKLNERLLEAHGIEVVSDFGLLGECEAPIGPIGTVDLVVRKSQETVQADITKTVKRPSKTSRMTASMVFPTLSALKDFVKALPEDPMAIVTGRPFDPAIDQFPVLEHWLLKLTGNLKNSRVVLDTETCPNNSLRISVQQGRKRDLVYIKSTMRAKFRVTSTSIEITPEIYSRIRASVLSLGDE